MDDGRKLPFFPAFGPLPARRFSSLKSAPRSPQAKGGGGWLITGIAELTQPPPLPYTSVKKILANKPPELLRLYRPPPLLQHVPAAAPPRAGGGGTEDVT